MKHKITDKQRLDAVVKYNFGVEGDEEEWTVYTETDIITGSSLRRTLDKAIRAQRRE